jgi:hypothetical protein
MVWLKDRLFAYDHALVDSERGVTKYLRSNTTGAQNDIGIQGFTSFNSNGFTLGAGGGALFDNGASGTNLASWTFRKQPKFFDVVTYTGTGANRTIAHSLGSVPGCIIIKRTDTTGDWQVYHRSLANTEYMVLNSTAAKATGTTRWNSTTPTASVFSLGTDATVNASGGTYVAYLFAHDAGGFGLSGADNVISCGTFNSGGVNGQNIELGYEPQWVLMVNAESGSSWTIFDAMRGWTNGGTPDTSNDTFLFANSSAAETLGARGFPYATGFNAVNLGTATYIYITIRRGPMKVPTSGTSVFVPISATTVSGVQTTGFPVDLQLARKRSVVYGDSWVAIDRLRGISTNSTTLSARRLVTSTTGAETTETNLSNSWSNTGFTSPTEFSGTGDAPVFHNFRRAPGFFDVVCYTGNEVAVRTVNHNLGVVPELMIVKIRSGGSFGWCVYTQPTTKDRTLFLNQNDGQIGFSLWGNTAPTSSVFSVSSSGATNTSGFTYIAYLFASCPGVSKVDSYTGTGAVQTINCGFTGGARFVMIKRIDSTGDWYVWDSARGIVAGNDPYLLLNSSAAEVTNTDFIDTLSTGFEISSTAPAAINANGGTFVYLAIA